MTEEQLIARMEAQGYSGAQVRRVLDVHRAHLWAARARRTRTARLAPRNAAIVEALRGAPYAAVATQFELHKDTVRRIAKRAGVTAPRPPRKQPVSAAPSPDVTADLAAGRISITEAARRRRVTVAELKAELYGD